MQTPEPRSWKWIQVAVVMAALVVGLVIAVWVENRPITPVNVKFVPLPATDARRLNLPNVIPSVAPDSPAPSTTQVAGGQLDGSQIDGTSGVATGGDKSLDPVVAGTPSADTLASPAYGGARAAVTGQTSSGSAATAMPSQSTPSYMPASEGMASTVGQPNSSPAETIPGATSGSAVPGSSSTASDGSAGVPAAYSPAGTPTTGSSSTPTGGF